MVLFVKKIDEILKRYRYALIENYDIRSSHKLFYLLQRDTLIYITDLQYWTELFRSDCG